MIEPASTAIDLAFDAVLGGLLDLEDVARDGDARYRQAVFDTIDAVIEVSGGRRSLNNAMASIVQGRVKNAPVADAHVLFGVLGQVASLERAWAILEKNRSESPSRSAILSAARLIEGARGVVQSHLRDERATPTRAETPKDYRCRQARRVPRAAHAPAQEASEPSVQLSLSLAA